LDVLSHCTVDLLHGKLITGVRHVVTLHCQQQNIQLSANPVKLDHVKGDSCTDQLPHVQERVESSSQTLNGIIKDQNCLHVDELVKVLGAKVKENVRIPNYSEIEIEVNGCTQIRSGYYVSKEL